LGPSALASRQSGECGIQVRGCGEKNAGYVFHINPIGLDKLLKKDSGFFEDGFFGIFFNRGRPTDSATTHKYFPF